MIALIIKFIHKHRALGKAAFLSMLNQIVSSLTNFGIMIYIVRAMNKEQFGFYNLGFALVLSIAGFITASISVPFVVNLPDQHPDIRKDYALNHAFAVSLLGLLLISLAIFIRLTVSVIDSSNRAFTILLVPIATTVGLYSVRDFLARVAFSEKNELIVLVSTLSTAFGVSLAFGVMWVMGCEVTGATALLAYATGQGAGCLAALTMLRLSMLKFQWSGVRKAFHDTWLIGRWNGLINAVYTVRTQAHNFVIAPLLGMSALAEVNAARVLVAPVLMAIPPLSQIAMPRLAERREQGVAALLRIAMLGIAGLLGFTIFYCGLLLIALPWILAFVLGRDYIHVSLLVAIWCGVALILAIRNGLTIVLQVIRAFRDLFLSNMLAAVLAVVLSISLTHFFGGHGAVIALLGAELFLCLVIAMVLRGKIKP